LPSPSSSEKLGPEFVPGLQLSERYFTEIVAPILDTKFPGLRYSAALLGTGSEVLGYDTPQSTDHNWGLRLLLFLPEKNFIRERAKINNELAKSLPVSFLGFPTSFGEPDEKGVRLQDFTRRKATGINHYIVILTIGSFFNDTLGFEPPKTIKSWMWLAFPQQKPLEITGGKIFRDDLNLKKVIARFSYYPRDVWLYLMAAQWSKISEEEAFVARASSVGDEIGSRIIASRITKELMELCFLMERKYIPYSKWFGMAFSTLEISSELRPVLENILEANSIRSREKWLSEAYHLVTEKHNSLHITGKLSTETSKFYGRPYLVIHADRFAKEIRGKISDAKIRRLPLIGSINQITDNSILLNDKIRLQKIYPLFRD
jgi:hypothetical protein